VFDDAANHTVAAVCGITAGVTTPGGTFRPVSTRISAAEPGLPLAALAGGMSRGAWVIEYTDDVVPGQGYWEAVTLRLFGAGGEDFTYTGGSTMSTIVRLPAHGLLLNASGDPAVEGVPNRGTGYLFVINETDAV
jgi:hypothetical protein